MINQQAGNALLAQRICVIGGGSTSLHSGRLAAILRGNNLLARIEHPDDFIEQAKVLRQQESSERLDDGAEPALLLRGASKNEITGFDCMHLAMTEESLIRQAGLDQLSRAVERHPVLPNSIEAISNLLTVRHSTEPDYWTTVLAANDALESDPFWRLARIRQYASLQAVAAVTTEIESLIGNMSANVELAMAVSGGEYTLFFLRNGQKIASPVRYVPDWSDLISRKAASHPHYGHVQAADSPWWYLVELLNCDDAERAADLLISIAALEAGRSRYELLAARTFALELENSFSSSEVDLVTKIAWLIAHWLSQSLMPLSEGGWRAVQEQIEKQCQQRQQIALLWPRSSGGAVGRSLTFGFDQPWTIVGLRICSAIDGALNFACQRSPEWAKETCKVLMNACVMEVRWPLEGGDEPPMSAAELTEEVGRQIGNTHLEQFGVFARKGFEEIKETEDLLKCLSEVEPGNAADLIIVTSRLARIRSKTPQIAAGAMENMDKWLPRQLSGLAEEQWPVFLENFIEALADPQTDPDRRLPWALCGAALKLSASEEALSTLIMAAMFAAVREEASNVTAVLTSREAPEVVRQISQGWLRIVNQFFGDAPETVRARLRPHLQYLGWFGR